MMYLDSEFSNLDFFSGTWMPYQELLPQTIYTKVKL